VNHLGTAFILISTISLAVAFGVASGYLIITGVLSAFARKPKITESSPALLTQSVAGD
jgi:hypothetical protein